MVVLVEELVQLWADRNLAVVWPQNGGRLKSWCGLIFLLKSSAAVAERRTQEIASTFAENKLLCDQSSLEMLTSGAAEKDQIPIFLDTVEQFSWVQVLVVLGVSRRRVLHTDTNPGSIGTKAKDVQQTSADVELSTNP